MAPFFAHSYRCSDLLRHRYERVNKLYIRSLGALMRESEVKGYNGVIWYLLGAFIVLHPFPKDIGVMGVLLLSWCDTAASTFGRFMASALSNYAREEYWHVAAFFTGVATALFFWGAFVPSVGAFPDDPKMLSCSQVDSTTSQSRSESHRLGGSDNKSSVVTGPWRSVL